LVRIRTAAGEESSRIGVVAPRAPSVDGSSSALWWAVGLGLYIWLFALAVGVSGAASAVIAALCAGGIFLFVRVYGAKEFRRPAARRDA
jgi:hypothetical protein